MIFVPLGNKTSMARPAPMAVELSISAGTSDSNAGWDGGDGFAVAAILPFLIQDTKV